MSGNDKHGSKLSLQQSTFHESNLHGPHETESSKGNFSSILNQSSPKEKELVITLDMYLTEEEHLLRSSGLTQEQAMTAQLKFSLISLAIVILILWIFRYKTTLLNSLIDFFVKVGELPEPAKTCMIWGVSLAIQVGGIPIFSLIAMIVTFCYGSFLTSYLVNFSTCLVANVVMALVLSKSLSLQESEGSEQTDGYTSFLVSQVSWAFDKSPTVASILVRFLHAPDYVKTYIALKFGIQGLKLWLPVLGVEALNVLLYTVVGLQIKSKTGLVEEVPFSQKTPVQQTVAVIVGILAFAQVVGLIGGVAYTALKYREFKRQEIFN